LEETFTRGEMEMFHTFRNTPMATTTKSAGTVLIAALISTGAAVADDISKVTGTVGGDIPLKVVILSADGRFRDIGRTPDYKTGSFSIDLKEKVSKYHWEVFAPKDVEPCDKKRDEIKSSINVKCLHSKVEEKQATIHPSPSPTAAPTDSQRNVAVQTCTDDARDARGRCPQQGSGQQHAAPTDSQRNVAVQTCTDDARDARGRCPQQGSR
jgi:hypothetical protein